MSDSSVPIVYGEEVREGLHAGRAVVALESNVITHGLEYPTNVETAIKVEESVRNSGAIPATTWVEDGCLRVGSEFRDLERLGTTPNIPKVSNRDIPIALASKRIGATTVAASMVIAEVSGIRFFSSAGIGGVHRNAERTMDISPDLIQLTRSKLAVVCAGAKNILDLKLTLEYLETHGVPLIAFQSDDFPAFYCVSSGIRLPHRLDDESTVVRAIQTYWNLGIHASVLVTHPISQEDAIPTEEVDEAIARAIYDAEQEGVSGAAITKYIMSAVNKETAGRSSAANASILISNAELAGRLAVEYNQMNGEPRL